MGYLQKRLEEIAESPTRATRYKHVEKRTTRTGQVIYYYREGKGKRIRLPDRRSVGEDAFMRAYQVAATGVEPPIVKRGHVPRTYGPVGAPGYIYFVRSGQRVKIGYTKSVTQRVKAIQTSCPEPIEVLSVMPGTTETERFMHTRFSDYRVGGEWFNLVGVLADFLGYTPRKDP